MTDAGVAPPGATWQPLPGVIEMLEAGAAPVELASHDVFTATTVRSDAGSPSEASYFDRLAKWFAGYRRDRVIVEHEPVWIPVAELWPSPKGEAELSYELSSKVEEHAELTLFGVAGLGSASKTVLADAFTITAKGRGRAYMVRAFLTVIRYVHKSDGSWFDRCDVDGRGAVVEKRVDDLEGSAFPLARREVTERQLASAGYAARKIVRLSGSRGAGTDTYEPSIERSRNWSVNLSIPKVPLLEAPVKIGAEATRSEAFKARYSLKHGADYVFFTRVNEAPVLPWCARLI